MQKWPELFGRLCHSAFLAYPTCRIDAFATIVAATRWMLLQRTDDEAARLHLAHLKAKELEAAHDEGRFAFEDPTLQKERPDLVAIEALLLQGTTRTRKTAKLMSLKWLEQQQSLPTFLAEREELVFDGVVDFSGCELAILWRLAELSLPLRFKLPIDHKERGLLVPVQQLLSKIESRQALQSAEARVEIELEPLQVAPSFAPFYDALFDEAASSHGDQSPVQVGLCADVPGAMAFVCEEARALIDASGGRARIGIALLAFDQNLPFLEQALHDARLPYNIQARLPLASLPAAKAVLSHFFERAEQEPLAPIAFADMLSEAATIADDEGLKRLFAKMSQSFVTFDVPQSALACAQWLRALLTVRSVGFKSHPDADAITVLGLDQLEAASFDHLFIVDLAETPLWPLVRALSAPRQSLFLVHASTDAEGREQVPGRFFSAAQRLIGHTRSYHRPQRQLVSASAREPSPVKLDKEATRRVFARWLGLMPEHPLTPTRLEAFAACPFRTMVERIFGVENPARDQNDVDARAKGRFVHAVLEDYFKGETEDAPRERLMHLIVKHQALLEGDETAAPLHPGLLMATRLWLSLVLERMISNMRSEPPVDSVQPVAFEKAYGFQDQGWSLTIDDVRLHLGGIIDRIDEGPSAVAVVDYKLSSAMGLAQRLKSDALLTTHFQLPLYLRLLLEADPRVRQKELYAYLLSVRDGSASRVLGREALPDLKARISDDTREDGLAAAIVRVMQPVLDGVFEPKRNDACEHCHLKRVCRVQGEGAFADA